MATIGRVDFTVDFDGKTLPQQARRIGQQLGRQLSRDMQAEFDRSMGAFANRVASQMNVTGKRAGVEFSNSLEGILRSRRGRLSNTLASMLADRGVFEAFVRNAGSVEAGMDRVTESLRRARAQGILNDEQFRSMTLTFRNWGGVLRENERIMAENEARANSLSRVVRRNLADAFRRFTTHVRESNKESSNFHRSWKSLPHGFRQFTFYVALFASLGSEIAILGSAAGSSLTVFLGAIVALLPAIAAFAIGISGIMQDLENVPAAVRPVAEALRGLGDDFSALRDDVTVALFSGLEGGISNLANTLIPALNSGLSLTATTLNGVLAQLLEFVSSSSFLEQLASVFERIQPIITLLISAAGNLAQALGNVFVIALPYIEDFASALNDLFARFLEFTTNEGAAIAEWFANGQQIIGAILPLLGAAATVLNNLVTPATIALFEQLMANLTTFLSIGGAGILNFLAILDPIGLIAQALADLSTALAPTGAAFMELAASLNQILSGAISALAPMIGKIVAALLPLAMIVVDVAAQLLDALLPALMPVVDAFAAMAVQLAPLWEMLGVFLVEAVETLAPVLGQLATIFLSLVQTVLPIAMQLFQALAPIFMQIIEAIGPLLTTILPPLVEGIGQLLAAVMPLVEALLSLLEPILSLIQPLLELIGPILGPLIELFVMLATLALEPLTQLINMVVKPALDLVVNILESWWPVIEGVMQILGGLINFLLGVFTGDWDRAWGGIVDIFSGIWNTMVGIVEGVVNTIIDLINGMISGINNITGAIGVPAIGLIGKVDWSGARLASGALVNTPTRALIGENGPEAVVPLNRPLGAVDPSVRALSAILQGKPLPASAGSSGPTVIVEDGAIRIEDVSDPGQAANAVMDRLVARVA